MFVPIASEFLWRSNCMIHHEFIRQLPKAEMHLHFEGSVPWDMIRDRADVPLPETPEWWPQDFRYTDFDHFGREIKLNRQVLKTLKSYDEVARRLYQGLIEQNVRYLEITFSVEAPERYGITIAEIATTLRQAAPAGLNVALFCGFNRLFPRDINDRLVQEVFSAPIDGIDLVGKETEQSISEYASVFEHAIQKGLTVKAHSGELLGPAAIWKTCRELKVRRIEHGVRAVEDQELMKYLADEKITLDICLTSNIKLGVVSHFAEHPVKMLFQRGVPVTVSTDDPTLFGRSLTDELNILLDSLDFTPESIGEIEKNAFRAALISEDERDAIFHEIDLLAERFHETIQQPNR